MYHLYIDESGDEGDYKGTSDIIGGSSQFFTLGGIIVRHEFRPEFTTELDKIKSDFFNNIILPSGFRLHYSELREKRYSYDKIKHPYDKLSREKRKQIANRVFDSIKSIDCNLISVTIDLDKHCKRYTRPASVMAYSMYLILERFQYFLEDNNARGEAMYERYNSVLRKKVEMVHKDFANNPNFPKLTDFNNIIGKVKYGDPLLEPILQFADFFAYAPWLKCTTKCEKISRYEEIKDKYYNLDYPWSYKRGNYEI